MSFKVYCKLFIMAIIGCLIAAGAPVIIGVGGYFLHFPIWGIVIGCLVSSFFSLFATLKYVDKCSDLDSWIWKE